MGSRVLNITSNYSELRAYAHCSSDSSGSSSAAGDVTLVLINLSKSVAFGPISLDNQNVNKFARQEFLLTAPSGNMESHSVLLNGKLLVASEKGGIPRLVPRRVAAGGPSLVMPPASYGFFVIEGANVKACMT